MVWRVRARSCFVGAHFKNLFNGIRKRRETAGPALGGQFLDDFWSRIRWWKGVAEEIAGSLGGRVRAWCGGDEVFLDVLVTGLLEAALKVCFMGSESDVREQDNFWTIFGLELDGGKAEEIAGSLGGRVRAWCGGHEPDTARRCRQRDRGVPRGPKAKERACSRLLQKFVLRDPKATLESCTGRTIFGRFLVSN